MLILWLLHPGLSQDCHSRFKEIVDWVFLIKLPKYGYFYYDSKMAEDGRAEVVADLKRGVDNDFCPVFTTFAQSSAYNRIQYIWNDKPASFPESNLHGKGKGILMTVNNSQHSILISHSFDRYPIQKFSNELDAFMNSKLSGPSAHFLCARFDLNDTYSIMEQIAEMRANTEGYYVVYFMDQRFYDFADANETTHSNKSDFLAIRLKKGKYLIVTKPNNMKGNIWKRVGEELSDKLILVVRGQCFEGWEQAHSIYIKHDGKEKLQLVKEDRNAKWAVGRSSGWVCVGDLESQSQSKSGGSVYCLNDERLRRAVGYVINEKHDCQIESAQL